MGELDAVLTDVLVAAGIVWLVARQFHWRPVGSMLRIALGVLGVGAAVTVPGAVRMHLAAPDVLVLAAELLLVGATGTAMGTLYRFRTVRGDLQCRLERLGLLLWAVFLGVRVGSFALAHLLGAHGLENTGVLLVSFGTNRLASALVVGRRSARVAAPTTQSEGELTSR